MRLANILQYFWGERMRRFWKDSHTKKILAAFSFFAIIIAIIFSNISPQQVMLRTDEVAKRNIVSNITAVVVDEKQTADLKQQATARVQKVFLADKYALANAQTEVNNFYMNLRGILQSTSTDKKTPITVLLNDTVRQKNISPGINSTSSANYLLVTKPQDIDKMEMATLSMVELAMSKPITEEAMVGVYNDVSQQVTKLGFISSAEEIIKTVTINAIRPNMIYNQDATTRAIKEAQDAVEPVHKTVKTGEIIVREGDRVTAEQISVLEQLGIQRTKSYPITLVGAAAFVLISFWLMLEYLRRYHKDLYENDMQMLLLGIIIIIVLLLARFVTIIQIADRPEINAMSGYLAPVAAGSMLIAILLDNRLAYFITMVMALYVGLLNGGNQLAFVIVAFISGTVGVYRVSRLSQTSDLAISGLYIAGANVATILAMAFIYSSNITISIVLVGTMIGVISGILSAVLMIGALPYLENGFYITSMIKLLELSNPNHELLKKLLIEAPGTYHHSLMVGNLAEASAQSIGANPLLVRVGAYYHDIGKIKRSEYFVENQRGFDDPHDKIAPALSALIIISHVKEGLELARDARLPQVIIDFIAEHHGTSLAKYFYSRALEEEGEGMVNEDSFRYEGPKPHSKEVALVMLADSVEAAVRSLSAPSLEKIRTMVRKILRDKLNDRQLEECDLTFKDVDVIANTFCRVLEGVYHKRIEYPDIVQELTKRSGHYGDDDNRSTKQG
ncbi:MAG: phosphohydrolase [Firmicutes bacterium HGW-Firmicutes-15]|nr:MAG: phosphohydrolase [Firmicutes bacterium HGW-Firmicutes-15]